MVSQSTESHTPFGRLNTVYWLLFTTLLGLPLITPLLRWTSVACTHDGHLHYHRVAAMAQAWADGIYLTRWLPDLAFGYGYPFFVYREAAPLYAVLMPFLAGLPLPAASNLFYAATILLCGNFMFLWVRDLFGPRAALVSAVAYMAAPYVLVDALVRGNAPESLALPLFPFLLWVGRRWVLYRSIPSFIGGVVGLALLSLGHNISTFIFVPTLFVYLLAIVWAQGSLTGIRGEGKHGSGGGERTLSPAPLFPRTSALIRVFSLVFLGLGLAIFYTGGALLEMDQVTLEMSTTTRNNDWRFNFASLGEILAPVSAEDPSLVNPPLLFRLGWAPMLLAAAGLTGLVWIKGDDHRSREQRLHIGLMTLGAVAYLFMALPISRWLWEALPLIDFVQFPWRFVGRAALPVAFLAGVPVYWFDYKQRTTDDGQQKASRFSHTTSTLVRGPWSIIFLGTAISLLILETIPNLYPRYCVEDPFPTIRTVHTYEHVTGLVGVDPEGSYFPRTVRERPSGSPLEADYITGQTTQRFDSTALPEGAAIRDIVYDGLGVRLTVESLEPFTARYQSFAFPGWTARVDDEPVPITPEDPTGLITFDVPAGTHDIMVGWGATPLRMALVTLSILSAIGVIAAAIWTGRLPAAIVDPQPTNGHHRGLTRIDVVIMSLLVLGLLGVKVFVDRNGTPFRRTAVPPLSHPTALQAGGLRLDGFNLSRESVPAGETFDIDMAWTAVASPIVDYQSEIALIGQDGLAWSRKGTERPRIYEDMPPTRQWTAGNWGWDSREVQTLSGTPPGFYDIVVTLFDKSTLSPATLVDLETGYSIGPQATIGQIEIVNPATLPDFTPQYPIEQDFPASPLRLLGYNQDRAEAAPGESVLMTFFWECQDPSLCEPFTLRLEDESGTAVEEWELPVIREDFPLNDWPDHGRLRGQQLVRLPADLASGRYHFQLEDLPLGELAITAPERQFTQPPLAQHVDAVFTTDDGIPIATLVGVADDSPPASCTSTPLPAGTCTLSLVWQVESETNTSYNIFVHLVDEAGNILTQSDAIPANWTRPTTGWLSGEYITDDHTLILPDELPAGPLSVRIGLYDPDTNERLWWNGNENASISLTPNSP